MKTITLPFEEYEKLTSHIEREHRFSLYQKEYKEYYIVEKKLFSTDNPEEMVQEIRFQYESELTHTKFFLEESRKEVRRLKNRNLIQRILNR